jgi:hypothetical protein
MDLQQRSRTFANCPLVLEPEGPTQILRDHGWPLWFQHQNEWFQGPLPLAEMQEAEPLAGVRGKAPALSRFQRLP